MSTYPYGTLKMSVPVKPITKKRLENICLYYLARYESSEGKLREMLNRRLAKTRMKGGEVPADAQKWIDEAVASMKAQNFLSDERFARNLAERCRRAGKSGKYIRMKLKQAGIADDLIQSLTAPDKQDEDGANDEEEAAKKLVKKRKLGYMRPFAERKDFFKKDLAVLARAGFSFDIAVKALNLSAQDEDFEDVCF